jgi:hypothetical protein
VQANTDYTLRVSVGNNKWYVVGGYAVELRAGGQLLGSASPVTVNDAWVVATVRYRALPGDPRLGQPLAVVLRKEATVYADQVDFDNVQLDASPIVDVPVGQGLVAHWKFDEKAGTVAREVTGQHDGQLNADGAAFVADGIAGGAVRLDRTKNGMVTVPHIPEIATNDFSIVVWAKMAAGDTTASSFVFSQHEAWHNNGTLVLLNTSPGWGAVGKASFMVQTGFDSVSSTTAVNDGVWHQIVATRKQGGSINIYVDGAPAEATRAGVPIANRRAPLLIGGLYGQETADIPGGFFSGWIDDVQLYSQTLTDAQVDLLFRNPGKNLADLPPADVTFTPVTGVPPAGEGGSSLAPTWGDYDRDGRLDLFVGNYYAAHYLYRNLGGGAFAKITAGPLVTEVVAGTGAGWADYDNDGWLDILVCNVGQDNLVYRGASDGSFTRAITFANRAEAYTGAWGDYDQDGYVDVFIARTSGGSQLWRNQQDGTFKLVTAGGMSSVPGVALMPAWCDYDNDGRLDLLVTRANGQGSLLYRSLGDGTFQSVTTGPVVTKIGQSQSAVWGDYDGDGWFDLFVGNRVGAGSGVNFLYRNKGDGTFAEVVGSPVVSEVANSNGSAWGDYDNDGWLDLFVANGTGQEKNNLYHNNGDGTFTKVTTGRIVNDTGFFVGCAWADYDDDGDLDMFVTRYSGGLNMLYRNDGTPNAWLKVTLTGTASNRAAIGAKVWVKATINGVSRWQVRQITGCAGQTGQDLLAHFGLGDAANVEALRVEWPSGQTSELTNQAVRQTLAIAEPAPPAIEFTPPGGEFVDSVSVTLKNTLGAGGILYTTDGSEPTSTSTPYTTPVLLTRTTTIRARVFFNAFPISEVYAATFTRGAEILFSPDARLFTNWVDVVIQNTLGSGSARFTLDGTAPTAQSPAYTQPIRLTAETTIRAQVFLGSSPVSLVYAALYQRVYTADDGIPDSWQERYFGPGYMTDPKAAADADPDADGANNAQEYAAGTIPTDPLSGFTVGVRAVPLISWASVVGQKYRILRKPAVTDPTWTTVVDNYVATNTPSKYVDIEAEGIQFYVIEVVP